MYSTPSHNPEPAVRANAYFFVCAFILLQAYDGAYFFGLFIQNIRESFILLMCFFGVINGLVRARGRGDKITAGRIYGAFFSLLVLGIGSVSYYQEYEAIAWLVAITSGILGVIVEGLLNMFFMRVESSRNLMSVILFIEKIRKAIWGVISEEGKDAPSKTDADDESP